MLFSELKIYIDVIVNTSFQDEQPFPLLLEHNATVLDPSVCREIYSDFRDYKKSFPEGLKEDSFLCLDYDGTKDFCKKVHLFFFESK